MLALPRKICTTKVPVTDANMTGMNPAMVYSIRMTSIAKITPAIGVLNDDPIAAAAPQLRRRSGDRVII